MKVQLLWFEDCPNHHPAEQMLREVLAENGVTGEIERIEVPDLETGNRLTFPGSPTIRIDRVDVEPGWEPCEDCTPRCRLYATSGGLRGLPERAWIEQSVARALAD